MKKEEGFSHHDRISIIVSFLCLFLIGFLTASYIIVPLLVLAAAVIISAGYSYYLKRGFNRYFYLRASRTLYIIIFSATTALIAAVILPYIIFPDIYMNTFLMVFIYILPVLFIFSFSLYFYAKIIENHSITYRNALGHAIAISLLASLIICILLMIIFSSIYAKRAELLDDSYSTWLDGINEIKDSQMPQLKVSREIIDYRKQTIEEAEKRKQEFLGFDKGLCISSDCMANVYDMADATTQFAVKSIITRGYMDIVIEEQNAIQAGDYKSNYSSMDDYERSLKNSVEAKEVYQRTPFTQDAIDLVEGDLRPSDLSILQKAVNTEPDSASMPLFYYEKGPSIMYNSILRVFYHTDIHKYMVRFIVKLMVFSGEQKKANDLFMELYDNRNADESQESKIIRYRILLTE